MIGTGGTFGIHALGRELFTDDVARLYVFNRDAELLEMDPVNLTLSTVLGRGPAVTAGIQGHSGLAGPLTDCDTGFTVD
jgi:hypothetical protein